MDKLIETAPATIWLCVSDEPGDYHEPFPKDLGEVTWAVDHSPVCCSVKYVRSDVAFRDAVASSAQLRREVERLRAVAEAAKPLVAACEKDFTSDATETASGGVERCWDEDSVSSGSGGPSEVTFGMIRKAAAALKALEAPHEG